MSKYRNIEIAKFRNVEVSRCRGVEEFCHLDYNKKHENWFFEEVMAKKRCLKIN